MRPPRRRLRRLTASEEPTSSAPAKAMQVIIELHVFFGFSPPKKNKQRSLATQKNKFHPLHPLPVFFFFFPKRFGAVSSWCLGEADRMLDMGFEPQIRKILVKTLGKWGVWGFGGRVRVSFFFFLYIYFFFFFFLNK